MTAADFLEKRVEQGITWKKYPAMTIMTPRGNVFPVPMTVNLGDS